ncbi:PREDICTED: uncharacterized protein LOC105153199 [Acromyrmex echinatior]|uniref:Translation initiation factor IF-3, mitochondrial n=1 Tax=Acromyrmex echinatior TaxID=103372 RepID=F4X5Y6_ACREC|nr:PREDICTED: uncharacterized protein LOC105153199 [Acromyrmex echinatior]EGI58133.1 hypothetical protein G5I_13779 [Acromyrmex echinatior]
MIVSGLSPALRKVVHLAQSFSRYRTTDQCRMFNKWPETDSNDNKKPRPKTEPIPKITLLSLDNSTIVTVLEVAQRLAKRRNLTLIKVSDLEDKTQRPLYKLVKTANLLEEIEDTQDTDKTAQKSSKIIKLFYISAKITEHDLWTKTKNMMKLLNKGHKVKVAITLDGADGGKMQRVIEDAVKNDGSIQRMSSKKNVILLLINPSHKNEDVSINNKNETNNFS